MEDLLEKHFWTIRVCIHLESLNEGRWKDLKPLDDNEWTLLSTSWRLNFNYYDEEENWDFLPYLCEEDALFLKYENVENDDDLMKRKVLNDKQKSIYSNAHIICKTDLFIEFYSILLYCKD